LFSIEDASGAIALRITGKNAANIDFAVGDVVNVDGATLTWDNGAQLAIDNGNQCAKVATP
jgi:hypothetical protein